MMVATRVCLLLSLLLGGCASIPQEEIAPTRLPVPGPGVHKPGVQVWAGSFFGDPELRAQAPSAESVLGIKSDSPALLQVLALLPTPAPPEVSRQTTLQVRQIFEASGLFAHVSGVDDPLQPGDYQILVRVYEDWPLANSQALAGMATLVTLGLFPSSRPQRLKVTMDVIDTRKLSLARLSNHDTIDERIGLINLAHWGSTREKAERDTLKRQLDALLKRMVDEGLVAELAHSEQVPSQAR
jgi:hypothetical protein